MKKLIISDKILSSNGELPITENVVGISITCLGDVQLNYSWNDNNKNTPLIEGESRSFGGFDQYTIGGNKLYYAFDTSGTTKSVLVTIFAVSSEEAQLPKTC